MMPLTRREVLLLGGTLLLGRNANALAQEPEPPPPAAEVPANWRRGTTVPLWPGSPPGVAGYRPQPLPAGWSSAYRRNVAIPELQVFRPRHSNGMAVLTMPGGAYWFVSIANEGADLAPRLTARGYTVFVLTYRLPGEGWDARANVPLQDAQRAVRLIRSRATEFRIDPAKVAVLGFSAGGHLAATLATRYAEPTYAAVDAADREDPRPVAAGLIYPVITMREPHTHALSRRQLLGDAPSIADVELRSADLQVGAKTPPVFLVHAMDDAAVPIENSLQMLQALRTAGRPVEAHLLQQGGHAFGIGRPGTPSAQWIELFSAWLAHST
jgi:acetyl esterase/lipase